MSLINQTVKLYGKYQAGIINNIDVLSQRSAVLSSSSADVIAGSFVVYSSVYTDSNPNELSEVLLATSADKNVMYVNYITGKSSTFTSGDTIVMTNQVFTEATSIAGGVITAGDNLMIEDATGKLIVHDGDPANTIVAIALTDAILDQVFSHKRVIS